MTGTFDINMQPHIHIELSDSNGVSFGGHLPSLNERYSPDNIYDCPIYTTLELVMISHTDIVY